MRSISLCSFMSASIGNNFSIARLTGTMPSFIKVTVNASGKLFNFILVRKPQVTCRGLLVWELLRSSFSSISFAFVFS